MPRRVLLAASVVSVMASVVGVSPAATRVARADHAHASYCADQRSVFRDRTAFVGITDPYVATGTERYRNCSFGRMAANHIGLFRGGLSWSQVQGPGTYITFAYYDQLVSELAMHHMRFLPTILGVPAGLSTSPSSPADAGYPPAHPGQFARFAAMCVRRYGPHGAFWREHPRLPYYPVLAWQIWNEPNLVANWEPAPDPVAYAHLLRAAYSAIKHVDRHAIVVTAGMPFEDPQLETSFLSKMFNAGARRAFDALAIHPYAGSASLAIGKLRVARGLLDRFGDGHKPLWVTEVAWAGGGARAYVANQRGQSQNLVAFFKDLHADHRLRVQKVLWYAWQDKVYGPDPSYWGYHLGLLTASLRAKLSLGALAKIATRLDR